MLVPAHHTWAYASHAIHGDVFREVDVRVAIRIQVSGLCDKQGTRLTSAGRAAYNLHRALGQAS